MFDSRSVSVLRTQPSYRRREAPRGSARPGSNVHSSRIGLAALAIAATFAVPAAFATPGMFLVAATIAIFATLALTSSMTADA
jgi:hypothetical protein